jgi:hypothetical protein
MVPVAEDKDLDVYDDSEDVVDLQLDDQVVNPEPIVQNDQNQHETRHGRAVKIACKIPGFCNGVKFCMHV